MCGDCAMDEAINILDIVFIINFIYKDGTTPSPLSIADVDGITGVNILDIIHMINFVYKNGADLSCS
jgi:hypothetical protein